VVERDLNKFQGKQSVKPAMCVAKG